ncbi:Diacylglycerol kinase, partial [Thalictrum thalictroides]
IQFLLYRYIWDIAMSESSFDSQNFWKEFYIPQYILLGNSEVETVYHTPKCPVLVFINSKSGGQLGGQLLITFRDVLNENQVFDLAEEAPDMVLRKIYVTLEKLKLSGDGVATEVQNKLCLIVAGGDGTASWLLGVVSDLKLFPSPPIATVPLGTGNNLPFSFGWGKKNPGTDSISVMSFMHEVMKAKEMKIDSWHILMRMRAPKDGSCDPIAPLELPHSLHAFHRVSQADSDHVVIY